MELERIWALGPEVRVVEAGRGDGGWMIRAEWVGQPACPQCGTVSPSRHSSYMRMLRDLPAQGTPTTVKLRVGRWRCQNVQCDQRIFAARTDDLAVAYAQRTQRVSEIVGLLGYSAGGRPADSRTSACQRATIQSCVI